MQGYYQKNVMYDDNKVSAYSLTMTNINLDQLMQIKQLQGILRQRRTRV